MKDVLKKLIKNSLISFTIIFTILSIATFIANMVMYYTTINEVIVPILNGQTNEQINEMEESLKGETDKAIIERYNLSEDAPVNTVRTFEVRLQTFSIILEQSSAILVGSIVFGVSMGIILTLSKGSKVKEIFIFIAVGMGLAIIGTIYVLIAQYDIGITEYLENFIPVLLEDVVRVYGLYYIIGYTVFFAVKYLIMKNKAKKLNGELKAKLKE